MLSIGFPGKYVQKNISRLSPTFLGTAIIIVVNTSCIKSRAYIHRNDYDVNPSLKCTNMEMVFITENHTQERESEGSSNIYKSSKEAI